MYGLKRIILLGLWVVSVVSVIEEDKTVNNLAAHHSRAFSTIQDKLQELRYEVNQLHNNIKKEMGHASDAVVHLEESLAQASDSAKDVSQSISSRPSPLVGGHAKRHVIREIIGIFLQIIGTYGILLVLGAVSYYCMTSLFVSGGIFVTIIRSLPSLFASALYFPPLLIMIIAMFDLSYVMSALSIGTLLRAVDSFGAIMNHPLWLEKIGLLTLFVGTVSSIIQLNKPRGMRY